MKLEKQVVSLELSKKLKELGVKQDSLFYWIDDLTLGCGKLFEIKGCPTIDLGNNISAFTVAELGELLPNGINSGRCFEYFEDDNCYCEFDDVRESNFDKRQEVAQNAKTEADARAKMLIYLIDNNLL